MPETIDTSNMSQEEIIELQKKQCPFCQIIAGKIPSKKVYEDDKIIAVLDINPISKGHVLVMPKEHFPIMPTIPEETLSHLFKTVKHISHACLKKIPCQGTNIFIANGGIAGQTAYHFMVFIIPRDEGDNIQNFHLKKIDIDQKELDQIIPQLKNNINIMLRDKLLKNPIPGKEPPKVETPKITEEQLIKTIEANPQLKQMITTNPNQLKQLIQTNAQLKMLFEGKDVDKIIKKINQGVEIVEPKMNLDAISEVLNKGEDTMEEDKEEKDNKKENKDEEKETEELTKEESEEQEETTKQMEKPPKEEETKEKPKKKKTKSKKEKGIDLDEIANLFS
tara:strand:- start:3129 stop:4136 length:1008 start_codon:yes stop_codon:yes gene_type:complete